MKAKTTGTWAIVATAAGVVALFVVSRSAAVEAVYPVERGATSFVRGVVRRVSGAWRGAAAAAECANLRRELAALAVVRNDIDRLSAENARLRKALGYAGRLQGGWIAAEVLSEGGGAAGAARSVRVSKGSLDGVEKGAAVAVPDGLVGLVTSVTPHTSVVTLIVDRSVKVACEIEAGSGPEDRPRGILAGGGDDMLVLSPVRGSSLDGATGAAPRARVLSSGLGGVFPAGLEIGTAYECLTNSMGGVDRVVVQPSVDYSSLEDVFIRSEK